MKKKALCVVAASPRTTRRETARLRRMTALLSDCGWETTVIAPAADNHFASHRVHGLASVLDAAALPALITEALTAAESGAFDLICVRGEAASALACGVPLKRMTGLPLVVDLRSPSSAESAGRSAGLKVLSAMLSGAVDAVASLRKMFSQDQDAVRDLLDFGQGDHDSDPAVADLEELMQAVDGALVGSERVRGECLAAGDSSRATVEVLYDPACGETTSAVEAGRGADERFTFVRIAEDSSVSAAADPLQPSAGVKLFLHAVRRFISQAKTPPRNIRIVNHGALSAPELTLARDFGLEIGLENHGECPEDERRAALAQADCLVLTTPDEESATPPAVLGDYLAARRFILNVSRNPETASILELSGAGVSVDPRAERAEARAADAIGEAFALKNSAPGAEIFKARLNRAYFEQNFTSLGAAKRLSGVFDAVLQSRSAARRGKGKLRTVEIPVDSQPETHAYTPTSSASSAAAAGEATAGRAGKA